jgi:oligopeptide transport system permease protein
VGARFSLIFAVIVSAINLTIGAIYGAIQGYYGGMIDMVLDRISDILSGVPFIVVTTLFQLHVTPKLTKLGSLGIVVAFLFAFVLTGWIGMAALTRKQFYRFKGQEFVLAARTLGASDWRLMFKHIFPNSLGTIVTSCALVIPGVINSEVSMSYLGIINLQDAFGTSIGTLAAQGQTAMTAAPHAMLFPSIFISLLLISFNLFGNGLRDAFNPATRGVDG